MDPALPPEITELYDKIQTLRTTACWQYDDLKAQGADPARMAKELAPYTQALRELITAAIAAPNVDQLIFALHAMRANARMLGNESNKLLEKSQDVQQHVLEIEAELMAAMQAAKQPLRQGKLYMATVATDVTGKRPVLVTR